MKIGIDVGKERVYNKAFMKRCIENIVLWEVLQISNGQSIKLTFISCKSEFRQGVWIATDKGIDINGTIYLQVNLWQDTSPKEVILKCHTDVGLLSFYNIWDDGNGRESQAYTSGMKVEQKKNILVYHCNNYGFETYFDDLVFSIEKL